VLPVLGFVLLLAVIGLGYLALIKGRSIRLLVSPRRVSVEIDEPAKPSKRPAELAAGEENQEPGQL
jgi:hypothetical protein